MSWKAVDRYSKAYGELQKAGVKFYKTPDSILRKQIEAYDVVVEKKSAADPLFKEIVESQKLFAERTVRWELDTVVDRRMAYNSYFGKAAAKPAAKKPPATTKTGRLRASAVRVIKAADR
jgi:TRAP-type mannitol/chloroaromatic compound transport system substrate-binding protein